MNTSRRSRGENPSIGCPNCNIRMQPVEGCLPGGVYAASCSECQHYFKFKSFESTSSSVSFLVNGKQYSVNNDESATTTLNTFIRSKIGLTGTKRMCIEGGCGACIVNITRFDPASKSSVTHSVNSCLCLLYMCDGWEILTPEGLGNRNTGYNIIQEKLADFNGSQCGFCSPGFTMNMYGHLKNFPKSTKQEIENAFDGNICRCTGYRPILDAMKSFAQNTIDIEDAVSEKSCLSRCVQPKQHLDSSNKDVHVIFNNNQQWFRPNTIQTLLQIINNNKTSKIKLVCGNTSQGVYKADGPFDIFIDIKAIPELFMTNMNSNVAEIGANVSIEETIKFLKTISSLSGFSYTADLAIHMQKVANVSVRSIGSLAGNLSMKYQHREFPSDLFVILETVNASLVLLTTDQKQIICSPLEYLNIDMKEKIILKIKLTALDENIQVKTYKVMPRSQNAHAYVNAGFLFSFDKKSHTVISKPNIVFGGISDTFVHASNTENFLKGKPLSDAFVLQESMMTMQSELNPSDDPVLASPEFRKQLALALYYKFVLFLCGDIAAPALKNGAFPLVRPLSSGQQTYDYIKSEFPLTKPMPKVTSLYQTAGEAMYTNDVQIFPNQIYGAFVLSRKGNAKIQSVDPTTALKQQGVIDYIDSKRIPNEGSNNYIPDNYGGLAPEQLFVDNQVLYAGQSIGLILAESRETALAAAELVEVSYSNISVPVTDLREAIAKKMFFPAPSSDLVVGDAEGAISKSDVVLVGEIYMGTQYHFTMETQSCLTIPIEDGYEVYATTQSPDFSQSSIAQVLGINTSQVHVSVKRLGGGYGSKISRNFQISAASALAAKITNRPVSVELSLEANMKMIGKRVPFFATYQIGATKKGKLNGLKVTLYGDHGCSPNDDTTAGALNFADNVYFCENWHLKPVAVQTHTPSTTSCRSPSSLPGIFIIETIMEHLAKHLNLDAAQLKYNNSYVKNQVTPYKQPLPYCHIKELIDQISKSAEYESRQKKIQEFNMENRWKKKGISLVPMKFGIGWTGGIFNVFMAVHNSDGTISLSHGGIEMGQGINTKAIQVCAYELGLPMSFIQIRPTETMANANTGVSGGSITSEICAKGIKDCCDELKKRLKPHADKLGIKFTNNYISPEDWKKLISTSYQNGVDLCTRQWMYESTETPFKYCSYGVTISEVELDVLTGENQINRVDILFDCGQSMNPELDIGQVEGAFVMGLGYFLLEEIKYDPKTGENLTDGTWEYKPPTTKDIPIDFRITLLKNTPNPLYVLRSKACGEPPLCMSSSVLFALKHAIEAARSSIGNDDFFQLDSPATVEMALKHCLPSIEQYVLN